MEFTYHPMHMHLHTCHQPGASMESHMYNAKLLNMHYIRFTDHDTRTGTKSKSCNSFDFDCGSLICEDLPGHWCGWEETYGEPKVSFRDGAMVLSESNDSPTPKVSGYGFKSSEKRHTASLIADVTLTLEFELELQGDAGLVLDVRMSQRPPDYEPAHLHYTIGNVEPLDTPHKAVIPLTISPDGYYQLKLSQDVLKEGVCEVVGGLDNVFDSLAIKLVAKNGGRAVCKLKSFHIDVEHGFDDVIKRQRVLADEIGKKYDIKPFVTTEISGAGQHKNCFSTCVPVIDYAACNYNITQEEAIDHVKKYGGVFSYNHPFSSCKRMNLTAEEREEIFNRDLDTYCATKLWGASLMEVAFLKGYGTFSFRDHLRLWDQLSLAGVFVTAYGDSDAHASDSKWFDGNNFVAWVAADSLQEFPVPEEVFLDSMKAGRLYTGDPIYIKGQVSLSIDGKPMGAIIPLSYEDQSQHNVVFKARQCQKEWITRVVIDGEIVQEFSNADIIDENGIVSLSFDLERKLPVSFARVEMYSKKGRCILLTNPVYLVSKEEFSGEIPAERLYE